MAGGSRPCRAGRHLLPGHTPASFQLKFLPGSSSTPPRPYPLPAPSQLLGERLKEVGPAPRGHLPGVLPSVLRPGAPACEPTALLWGWSRRGSRGGGTAAPRPGARGGARHPGPAPACGSLASAFRLPPTCAPGGGWPKGLETHFPVGQNLQRGLSASQEGLAGERAVGSLQAGSDRGSGAGPSKGVQPARARGSQGPEAPGGLAGWLSKRTPGSLCPPARAQPQRGVGLALGFTQPEPSQCPGGAVRTQLPLKQGGAKGGQPGRAPAHALWPLDPALCSSISVCEVGAFRTAGVGRRPLRPSACPQV